MNGKMSSRTKKALCVVIIGIAANLALALTKFFVGLRSNSLCILLDSTNGFFDTLTGIITAVAFGLVALPPSEKFPYGYGRSEYLAGFVIAVVAAIMGVTFLLDSLDRMAMPEPVWFGINTTIILAVGIAVKLGLAIAFMLVGRKIRSKALKAVAVDSYLDVGITSATLLSFTLSAEFGYALDAIAGIVISIVVLGVSVKMIVDAVRNIIGKNECEEEKSVLIELCKAELCIDRIDLIRLHDYGYRAKYGTVTVTFSPRSDEEEQQQAISRVTRLLQEQTGTSVALLPSQNQQEP